MFTVCSIPLILNGDAVLVVLSAHLAMIIGRSGDSIEPLFSFQNYLAGLETPGSAVSNVKLQYNWFTEFVS